MTVALLTLLSLAARAADSDWIDELPTVTTVAHAVAEQLKVDTADWRIDLRGIAVKDDDDLFAVYMVGTLVLMRQIILYKYQGEESLTPERDAKLRCVVAGYLEAELYIGEWVGKRRGYLTTGQKCKDDDCYRRWFRMGISNVRSASYRGRILPRLFPNHPARAAELDQLAQSYAVRAPYLPSPAETLQMEPEAAGLAPAGCSMYGGDANRNGICDHWQDPKSATGAHACRIVLEKVRMAGDGGLRVTLPNGAAPGSTLAFRLLRAASPVIDAGAIEIWPRGASGDAVIQPGEAGGATPYAIVAKGVDLTPDPSHPILLVEVTSAPAAGPVHCEQPLKTWLRSQLTPHPDGLHGPYDTADIAVQGATGEIALRLTLNEVEHGFLVMRDLRKRGYYTTPPTGSTVESEATSGPRFSNEDYARSLRTAFERSCEEMENFAMVALVHTHPPETGFRPLSDLDFPWPNDNFSMLDFNQAIFLRGTEPTRLVPGLDVQTDFERAYVVVTRTGCIKAFAASENFKEELFTQGELEFFGLPVINWLPKTLERYRDYVSRQRQLPSCFRPNP